MKWFELAKFIRVTDLKNSDFEALNQSSSTIDTNVLRFRNKFLANICRSLPYSPSGSPLMRGIYACSASYIEIDKIGGFLGKSVTIRSKADINVKINNLTTLSQDNHLAGQAVGKLLNASPKELYKAKLDSRMYDTTAQDVEQNIGSFEMCVSGVTKDDDKSASIGVYSESDGAKVSRKDDDFSTCGIYIYGEDFR